MKNILTLIFLILCFVSTSNAQNAAIFSGDGVKLLKNKLKFKDTDGAIRFDSGNVEITTNGGTTWTPLGGTSSSSLQLVDADGDSTADFFTDDAFFIKLLNQSGFTFKVDSSLTTLKNVLKIDTTNNFLPLINPILTNTIGSEDQVETYLKFEHKMDVSATPTVGFGAAQSVWLENSVDVLEHASKIETKWTDVTNTGEDAVMIFSVFTNGIPTPVEHIKLENNELHLLSRAGVEGKVVFHEQGTNGTDTLTISAPALGQSKEYTLPPDEPAALVPQSLLAVTPAGAMSWVDPDTLLASDTTRITDGGAVWVDTDEVASSVVMNIGTPGGARAVWSTGQFTIDNFNGTSEPANIAFSEAPANGNDLIKLSAPQGDVASYGIWFPAAAPGANQILQADASDTDNLARLSWVDPPRYCTMSEQYDLGEFGQNFDPVAYTQTVRPFNAFTGDCSFLTSFAGEPIADTTFSNDVYYTGFQWQAGSYHIQCKTKFAPQGTDSLFYTLYNVDTNQVSDICSDMELHLTNKQSSFNCSITLLSPTNITVVGYTDGTLGRYSSTNIGGSGAWGAPFEKNGQCLIIKYR